MKAYHIYFFILKFIILLLILLMSIKVIAVKSKIFVLIESLFKFSLGLFIIIFFSNNNFEKLSKEDRVLIILSGFILIILIDYIELINIIFNKHIKDDRSLCYS